MHDLSRPKIKKSTAKENMNSIRFKSYKITRKNIITNSLAMN